MKHALISDMPTAFDPQAIEAGWYARWESDGLFVADAHSKKQKYAICLPPPNITGGLHMGHALNHTLQDINLNISPNQATALIGPSGCGKSTSSWPRTGSSC